MKTLTKIKFINWHGFYNETIKLKGRILVTGDTGTGKSTFLDGCYFLLTGGDDNKFNTAANEKAARSLEGYMRGKVGLEERMYLRNDVNLISHIAMEFYDDKSKNYFVLGVVLEIQDGKNKPGRSFYTMENSKLAEEYFIKDNYIVNFQMMKKHHDVKEISGSREQIRREIYTILHLEKRKYYELLPKALAFKPISDVSEFVYQFLLPEKNIDLESMRVALDTYKEILALVELDKQKTVALQKIVDLGEQYRQSSLRNKLLLALKQKIQISQTEAQIKVMEKDIGKLQEKENKASRHRNSIEETIKSLTDQLNKLQNNNAYQAVENLEKEVDTATRDLKRCEQEVSDFNKLLNIEQTLISTLKLGESEDFAFDLLKFIKTNDFDRLKNQLEDVKTLLDEKKEKNILLLNETRNLLKTYKKDHEEKSEKISRLKKGYHTYDEKVISLIDIIETGIKSHTGKTIKVTPFCELIDLLDDSWRDALEGYLNTKRFDLFVPRDCYDLALSLYEKYKKEKKIYGVGLVNLAKIKETEVLENSLATKVVSENDDAKLYADYLLGGIVCVEDEQQLKNFEASITKTVMVYKNKAARQTNFAVFATPFIGRKAVLLQLKKLEAELVILEANLIETTRKKETLREFERLSKTSKIDILCNYKNVWQEHDECHARLFELTERLNLLKKSSGGLLHNIDELKNQIKDQTKESEEQLHNAIRAKTQREDLTDKVNIAMSTIEEMRSSLQYKLSDPQVNVNFDQFVNENKLTYEQIDFEVNKNERTQGMVTSDLMRNMAKYIEDFKFDATSTIDSLDTFNDEFYLVVQRGLGKHEENLKKAELEASEIFKTSYIYEIRRAIQDEERNIDKLNKALENKPFGNDGKTYKFKINKATNPEFGDFYEIFKSAEVFQPSNLFEDELTDKNQILMSELFLRLSKKTEDSKELKLIRQYTDYRSFMSYDIEIKNKHGETSKFSRISREKSGGETQTPFYVIIAASFEQIIENDRNRSSCGLVLFDEAFNNMDESHIDSMMSYFKQLNIQPVIAVPSQRAPTIMPHVDTTVAVAKSKDRVYPRTIINDEQEDN